MGFARVSSNLILVGVLLIASIFLNSTNNQLSPVSNRTRWPSGYGVGLSNPMGFARISSNLILVAVVRVLLIASIFLNSTNIQLSPVSNMTRWLSG